MHIQFVLAGLHNICINFHALICVCSSDGEPTADEDSVAEEEPFKDAVGAVTLNEEAEDSEDDWDQVLASQV